MKKKKTPGQVAIDWIEQNCHIPEGKDIGKSVKLRSWQRREIDRIYSNPRGTRRAIVSFGRKNGKTALASFLLLLHLCGPMAKQNSQLYSAAQSREQAALIFNLAAKIVRLSPRLRPYINIRDTAKQLFCPDLGTLYRALSAEASTAFGLSPVFIIHDELGQVKGSRSPLYEALETATGAQENPLSIIISTQAPTDADLLSILVDDALAGNDERVVVSLYSADLDLDPFGKKAIQQANPALGDFLNEKEVLSMAEDARRMPSREAEYRNLILNQRVDASSPFVSQSLWKACGEPVLETFAGLEVFGGLDLSEVKDLTCLVLVAQKNGKWHVKPVFWLPGEGLRERARSDRVPYDVWHKDHFLQTTPGKSVDYDWVAVELFKLFNQLKFQKIAFDGWNMRHLKPCLLRAGFTEQQFEKYFVEFRQGYKSMSPALRDLEALLLNETLCHGNHPVLSMCAANAVVQSDPAGNRKLTKSKSHGRIDGMVALTMAIGVANTTEPVYEPVYQMAFV